MSRRPHLSLALLTGTLLLVGCGPVEVARTNPDAADRAACAKLMSGLPDSLADQPRRKVEDNPRGAAWGDPAITLRCGATMPASFSRFAPCQTVNDIDWYVPEKAIDDQGIDVVMTTIGRRPIVQVRVPAQLRPPASAMVDAGKVVAAHTRALPGEACR